MAHSLGEIEASREFGLISDKEYLKQHRAWLKEAKASGLTVEQQSDMTTHISDYVDYIGEQMKRFPHSQLLLEQRLDTGVPTCWGTSDVVIVSPQHVHIIDLKYGAGIAVSATNNPQTRLYACGAMDTYADLLGETEIVISTIFQPRMDFVSSEEISPAHLAVWRETYVLPLAEEALGEDAHFQPSEDACRWCPAAGQCKAQLEWATNRAFGAGVDLLTPEEIGKALEDAPAISKWLESLKETALRKAYSEGVTIPGHKIVLSGGTRVVTDEDVLYNRFKKLGFKKGDFYTKPKLVGLGSLESLLKTMPKVKSEKSNRDRYQTLEDVLPGEALGRTPGKPAIVLDNDKRPAIDPNSEAKKEFSDDSAK